MSKHKGGVWAEGCIYKDKDLVHRVDPTLSAGTRERR